MTSKRERDASLFFLILTVVFGSYVRLFPVISNTFPLVDGGMFYTMIKDLQTAHFALPVFTTYNRADIPFAYPPLAFYIAAVVNALTKIPSLLIIQWMPVIISLLTIPVFYLFARRVVETDAKAALATLIFALTPNSYWWDIVGGGLTRSMGTFLFLVTAISARQMYRTKKPIWIVCTVLGGSLVVLSHLSWALQSALVVLLIWIFEGRDQQGLKNSAIVVLAILLLTSPWWITVLQHHGPGVFLQAGQVTNSRWLFWTIPFTLSFTGEYTTVIAVLALIGLFIQLAKKEYFFPLWATACLLIDPRGGIPASVLPFTILAASAITDAIASQLIAARAGELDPGPWIDSLYSKVGRLFFGFFIILFAYNAFSVSNTLSYQVLSGEDLAALSWVSSHTAPQDEFLILDEQGNPLLSALTEWFPALTGRRSVATLQGTEWLSGYQHYNNRLPISVDAHECIYRDVACIHAIAGRLKEEINFIIISSRNPVPLLSSLQADPAFDLVYASSTLRIFKARTTIGDIHE